ncbi:MULTISPECIES: DUF3105 domain-containing protein [unclassified Nocardia]|uniref:DUF3105 domain-containing protein n=1 Tax=unclassified Nocardia TaxID=2637762 RepID=UPI001CE3F0A0|nr:MULTISPECIES: DUF3105 domain-containing protein [unclassified Nocardia]
MPSRTSAKSAKAVRAAGKSSSSRKRGKVKGQLPEKRRIPWPAVGAAVLIIALVGALAYSLVPKYQHRADEEKFTPSAQKQDPSDQIPGVVKKKYEQGYHVNATQRVNYDQKPPFGGPHDFAWATCTGIVYPKAIRTENAVHSLEHGAVWITYNPDKVDAAGVDALKQKVSGQQYTLMSPYPGLDTPISLQSWGHQLKLNDPGDKRIDEFLTALRRNPYTYPERDAVCSTPAFDTDNPPPFDPTPPGPDAVQMDGKGANKDTDESAMGGLPPGIPGLPPQPGR